MSNRTTVLSKIRRSLGVEGTEVSRRAAVTDRLQRPPKGVIPARGQLAPAERLALFQTMAEKVSATVERVASADDVPAALATYLRSKNLPAEARRGRDPRLEAMPWDSQKNLDMRVGPSDGRDVVGLSHAQTAIAEAGTLVLTSGPSNPTTLNFLPDHHVVVVEAASIVGDIETALATIRATHGKGEMPRTVNFVTGPSRSGDIEQTILLGAHGPRALHIVIVGEP